jgi:Domain of unknown function (DUF4272)
LNLDYNPNEIKSRSEKKILDYGGRICDWLPILERSKVRPLEEVVGRALVLNVLLEIHFEAPIEVVKKWIETHNLNSHLTAREREILSRSNNKITKQESIDLYWYIESLWALMWATSIIKQMPFDQGIPDDMVTFCPNLRINEGPEKFTTKMKLRSDAELFQELDLYYRLHWWTRDANLNGYETGDVSLDIVMERRKALEWLFNPECDWDNVPDHT